MARAIVMPSVGMYTAEGTLVKWLRPHGNRVEAGEAVAEVETEKATYELEAAVGGILHHVAGIGTNVPVQGLIGYILAEGEALPSHVPGVRGGATTPKARAEPTDASAVPRGDVRASPVARRLAAERGVDLAGLRGSGPGGRIVEADVMAAIADASPVHAIDGGGTPSRVRERIPLKGMRGAIADRVRRSLTTAASITITREARAGTLVEARQRLAKRVGSRVPYDALFVKLFAAALREHPVFNSIVERDSILVLADVHVGFAVAVPGGLMVPVVRDADSEPLTRVVSTVRELRARALAGKLRPADVASGTASITNLGSLGVDAFTPILNPPQSAILGIGRIVERPVVDRGGIVPAPTCMLSLTFDHRVADGVPAARLLESVAQTMLDERQLDALTD